MIEDFFDSDGVRCVTLIKKVSDAFPKLNWSKIKKRFSWDINGVDVMSVDDLKICVRLQKDGIELDEVEYTEIVFCDICGEVLLPDDEAYNDIFGSPLCDRHSEYVESSDDYVAIREADIQILETLTVME